MRLVSALAVLAGSAALAQQPKAPDVADASAPRYGVPAKARTYPQDTPKKALASALEAIEKGEVSYVVAHLMDPDFVELRLGDRAKQYEAGVETELARLRDLQIRNPDKYAPEDRLPTDRARFAALVVQRSREQAFKQLVRDVSDKLLDDPQAMKDLRKLLRDGAVSDTGTGVKLTHDTIKDRALYLRKIGERYFLENRQEDAPAPKEPAKKEPDMKKN